MSEGIDAYIKKKFEVPDVDIRTYSPLTLAYIGDGVFDLVIRSVVVGKGNTRPQPAASPDESDCKSTYAGSYHTIS